MKKFILSILFFLFPLALCSNSPKVLTEYLDEVHAYDVYTNIEYDTDGQYLDLYYPWTYATDVRPVFIYVHGGSFQYGSKNNAECELICSKMAKRGYIAISINYRLTTGTPTYTDVVNAVKDLASVRSLVQYAADNPDDNPLTVRNSERLCTIDASKVVMGGDSAGGLVVFMSAAQNENMMDDTRFLFESDIVPVQAILTLWTPFKTVAGSTFNVAPYDDFIQEFPMFIGHGDMDISVDVSNSQDLVYYSNSNPDIYYKEFWKGQHGAWINGDTNMSPQNGEGFYSDADSLWYAWCKDILGL